MKKKKEIKDFFPPKDVEWFKSYGGAKIATILDTPDTDANNLLFQLMENNGIKCYRYLKANFLSERSVGHMYNVNLVDMHIEYYKIENAACLTSVYENNANSLYNVNKLPNCFIDYIRNL